MRKQGEHHPEDMKKSLQAFLINLIVSMAIICPFIIADGGIFAITNDFNFQTIDFGIAINDAIMPGCPKILELYFQAICRKWFLIIF